MIRAILRLGLPLALVSACAWHLSDDWAALDGAAIGAALAGIAPSVWCAALLSVTVAYVAVAGQERAVMAHLGLTIDRRRGRIVAMATAGVSQTVGFGPLVSTVMRKRLLPELSLAQSAHVSLLITLGFLAGIVLVWSLLQTAAQGWAGLALVLMLGAMGLRLVAHLPAPLRRHLPGGWIATRFLLWLAVDLGALGVAAWLVLPCGLRAEMPLLDFLPLFLTALGAGLASGSPAGAGPFDAILLGGIEGMAANDLAAGIIAFRLSAYAIPAAIGAVVALLWPGLPGGRVPGIGPVAPLVPVEASPVALRRFPRAELQLALQGELGLLRGPDATHWLQGHVAGCAVFLGDPVAAGRDGGPSPSEGLTADRPAAATRPRLTDHGALRLADAAVQQAAERAARQGRMPCLYRAGPRLAARARARGWVTHRIAQEAILDPRAFTTCGAARAGLRRKLRHAEQAGVRVTQAALLPMAEMAQVAAQWSASHGGERGFSMGRFDPASVQHQIVLLARAPDGRLLGFVTFHGCAEEWVLDLIRCRRDVPDGTLYAVIAAAIAAAGSAGIARLSLAAVPEPGWGVEGRLAPAARRLSSRVHGLAQFKQAFRPRWEPRYIAAPTRAGLVFAALAIARAVHRRRPARRAAPGGWQDRKTLPEQDAPQDRQVSVLLGR